jgi:hypothetical protein
MLIQDGSIVRALTGAILVLACGIATTSYASQTENLGMSIPPAPGAITIDGNLDDWDLSGGIFACDNVEHARDSVSVWCFAMYDEHNIYLAAHFRDPTPMSNTGQTGAELMPFNSDSLQVRFITRAGTERERVTHLTGWQGKGGKEVIDLTYGRDFHGGNVADAKNNGAQQAFKKDADGKGYVQEIALPWELITSDGKAMGAGEKFNLTWEANFSVREGTRLSIKDCFSPNVKIDRIFTFNAYSTWGWATLEPKGKFGPRPVRLADGREFSVTIENGVPIVAWEGLVRDAASLGNKVIAFEMPQDGFVSLIIRSADGTVVRQLVNGQVFKAGQHEVRWDGLTTPTYQTPGDPVPPGEYEWSAIFHTGVGLRLRGFASNAGRTPWDDGPTSNWGGDQGPPSYCATDGERVYLGWHQAEAGKGLLACDSGGNVLWHNNRGGFGGGRLLAADRDTVYNFDGNVLYRLDAKTGDFTFWEGTQSTDINIAKLWDNPAGHPDAPAGMTARDGKLYLSFNSPWFLRTDITDWRGFLARIQEEGSAEKNTAGKMIWNAPGMNEEARNRLSRFVKAENPDQKILEAQPFVTEDVRDIVVRSLVGMQKHGAFLSSDREPADEEETAWQVRRLIEERYGAFIAKAAAPAVVVLDGATGKVLNSIEVVRPSEIKATGDGRLLAISGGSDVVELNLKEGSARKVIEGISGAKALAVGDDGTIYVGVGAPDNQVRVYDSSGKFLRAIGRPGGRPLLGAWVADGLAFINSLAIDAQGQLWVVERDDYPKRISTWDPKTGKLLKEFFGPTHYGASGGAINPEDANIMAGEGCEWRLDPKTGRAQCLGVFAREQGDGAIYGRGGNGKTYLLVSQHDALRIYERLGDGQFALRSGIFVKWKERSTTFWSDENGDAQQQPDELRTFPTVIKCGGGWYINATRDMTLFGGTIAKDDAFTEALLLKVTGFTPCGAPIYDPDLAPRLPRGFGPILGSPDGRLVLYRGSDADAMFRCYDVATGKLLWTYPNPFAGVHGSHAAPPPMPGLIRGSLGIVGSAQLPDPVGAVWAINTNVGEWHLLTEKGYYLTKLFEGDPTKMKFPPNAEPGAILDHCPPGLGGEDFGGSFMQTSDGQVLAQAGKVGLWNVQVTGLESVKALASGRLTISEQDVSDARDFREQLLQPRRVAPSVIVRRKTIAFTGDFMADFEGTTIMSYRKQDDAAVRSAMAWDDQHLYVAWEVQDATPWTNSATEVESMYLEGDTVDLQLGTDPKASKERGEAVAGDLRLSIGNFKGTPSGVIYRRVSDVKKPKTFASGVTRQTWDYVDTAKDLVINVTNLGESAYLVEAAIPLAALGLKPESNLSIQGDVGVTHGDPSGSRTRLRTYWANQKTGIVDDAVFELQLEPRNWGTMTFQP